MATSDWVLDKSGFEKKLTVANWPSSIKHFQLEEHSGGIFGEFS